ncbi:MAG: hypothetical protein E6344_05475 [Clostridium sp.]|nr:hypothetical protein [Clostridium sp.]MDU7083121.1 hypothetical protein [Clostridium sp.]
MVLVNNKEASISKEICNFTTESIILRDNTMRLHGLLHQLPRYKREDISKITFDNGICFFFEEGETYNGYDRVVRVGAHIVNNKLKQRLRDHYKPNQEGSVFRKSIGKALLRYDQYKFEEMLDIELSRGKLPQGIKKYEKEKNIEQRITKYLNNKFSFVCVKVADKKMRLRFEEGIVALLHNTEDFKPSSQWFGRYSPNEEIRNSGLWLREGLKYMPLTAVEVQKLEILIWESI